MEGDMFIKRHIKDRLMDLLNDFRIVYLTGPRQAGKSTLVRDIAKEQGMGYYTLGLIHILKVAY